MRPGETRWEGDRRDRCQRRMWGVGHTFRHVSVIFTWVKTSIHWQNHMFLSLFVQWQGAYSLWAFLTVRHGAKTTGGWWKKDTGNPKTLHPRLYLYCYIMLISQIQINIKTTILYKCRSFYHCHQPESTSQTCANGTNPPARFGFRLTKTSLLVPCQLLTFKGCRYGSKLLSPRNGWFNTRTQYVFFHLYCILDTYFKLWPDGCHV